jgi:hypothetical protein
VTPDEFATLLDDLVAFAYRAGMLQEMNKGMNGEMLHRAYLAREKLNTTYAELSTDAERYRWLRSLSDPDGGIPHVVTLEDREPIVHVHLCYGDDLDKKVDEWRSKE